MARCKMKDAGQCVYGLDYSLDDGQCGDRRRPRRVSTVERGLKFNKSRIAKKPTDRG